MKPVTKRIFHSIWFDLSHLSLTLINIYLKFFRNKINTKSTKIADFSSEIFFWEREYYQYWISGNHPRWWNANLTKNRYSPEMRQIIDILTKVFHEELRLIDVGSGPVTSFFNRIDITQWNIVTVDPLADLYNYLNKKYQVNYPLKCIEGTGESLNSLFDKQSFHLVLSQNAIDHATSPKDFIKQLYYILKPSGFLYLSGFINEGLAANWKGLHQHNLSVQGNHLVWTNRDKSIHNLNLTKDFKMKLFYKNIEGSNAGDRFTLIYQKNNL